MQDVLATIKDTRFWDMLQLVADLLEPFSEVYQGVCTRRCGTQCA